MSKLIKITTEYIAEACEEFKEALSVGKFAEGEISFTKTFSLVNCKATVFFTEIAWLKMQTLIREFDKEVAWHGIAKRGDDITKNEYYITDILVYPQEVSGVTVNTDQEKYQMWLMNHEDDIFDNIRMQGHSHVNMGTTPSGVDSTFYERILEQLKDDMFYIFMIWNKKKEKTVMIYDLLKNILFETNDVTIEVFQNDIGIESFLKDAKEMVKDKTVASYGIGLNKDYSYSGYGKYSSTYSNNYNTPSKEDAKTALDCTSKKRKGKRKGQKSKSGGEQITVLDSAIDDIWKDEGIIDPFYIKGY